MRVLVICSANRCRSPMGAALLQRHADALGAPLEVASAGFGAAGYPAEPETVAAMAEVGVDLSQHRSRQLDRALLEDAGLVLTMTRQQLIDAVLLVPSAWERLFTLVDLAGRAVQIGPRGAHERPEEWVVRAQLGRSRRDVVNLSTTDDIADPVGRPLPEHVRTRDQLDRLTLEVARRLSAEPGVTFP